MHDSGALLKNLDDAIDTGSLQIFSGTLTEIICSADHDVPVFHLVTKEGMEYDQHDYNLLPGLFDMEAVISPERNNVTLLVNGTNCSNNVTVICRDLRNAVLGQIETLFTLVLEFVSKFSHLHCILLMIFVCQNFR